MHGFISGLSILFHWSLCLFLCQYHTVAGALSAGGSGSGWSTKRGRELSHVRGLGSGLECQAAMVQEWPRGATPRLRSGAVAGRNYPASEARGGGREELPCVQGQGQWPGGATPCLRPGGRPRGATPHPRSGGCMGAGGPRGATPRSRSGGVAVRRYPSSKVRSSGSTSLEQP